MTLLILLSLLLTTLTESAIYEMDSEFHDYVNLTEGQVFSLQDTPLGISANVEPIVASVGYMKLNRARKDNKGNVVPKSILDRAMGKSGSPPMAYLHAWIFHESNMPLWPVTCIESKRITEEGETKTNQNATGKAGTVANEPTHTWFLPDEREMYTINITHSVAQTGIHYIFFKLCDHQTYDNAHQYNSLYFE